MHDHHVMAMCQGSSLALPYLTQVGVYVTITPHMEHHVLRWTGSPSEDHPSVSNVSKQSLVRLPTYRMSHHHDIHLDTSQVYWPNPTADHHQMHPLQIMHDHPEFIRPQQPSVYMMAYLSTHTHLTHGQMVFSPIALAGLMAACTCSHASLVGL